MNDFHRIFSQNLRDLMEEKGKIQQDLINDLGFSSSTTSSWCSGQKLPRMDKIQILAEYLGVEVTDLLEEKGSASYFRRKAVSMLNSIKDERLEQVCTILGTFLSED